MCGSYLLSQIINFLRAQTVIILFQHKVEHNVLHRVGVTLIFTVLKITNFMHSMGSTQNIHIQFNENL